MTYAPETLSSTDRRMDGRTDGRKDKVNPVYPPSNFVERGYNYENLYIALFGTDNGPKI